MLFPDFAHDPYPGRPKILFIGLAESTHTHAWINLLQGSEFNVRLFAVTDGVPPPDWLVPTYVTSRFPAHLDSRTHIRIWPFARTGLRAARVLLRGLFRRHVLTAEMLNEYWLAAIIRHWKPD